MLIGSVHSSGPQLSVKVYQSWFFDRPAVKRLVDQVTRQRLSKVGAYIRRAARSSMKKARQQRLSELPHAELVSFRRAEAIAKRAGRPAPRRPLAASRPGEPPRVRAGHLKRFLYFALDPATTSVVIGPAALSTRARVPAVLEFGGTVDSRGGKRAARIEPRPYMGPALEQELPRFRAVWGHAFTQV